MADENKIVDEKTEATESVAPVEPDEKVQSEAPVTEEKTVETVEEVPTGEAPNEEAPTEETSIEETPSEAPAEEEKKVKAEKKPKKKKAPKVARPPLEPKTKFGKFMYFKVWGFLKKFGLGFWNGVKHIPYCGYCLLHPAEGFFRMKTDKRKQSVACAVILYVLLAFSAIAKQQLTSYIFGDLEAKLNLDVFAMTASTVLPYILWVIASWCFTSLMDGEGNLKDIFCATAAATIPMTVVNIVLIPLSHLISPDESNFYVFIGSLGAILTYAMMFLSMMFTQQYSVKKAIGTTLLTIIGMAVIAFVVILIFYLIQQVWGFITSVFSEITYRLNE